jgi:hypothetical protein
LVRVKHEVAGDGLRIAQEIRIWDFRMPGSGPLTCPLGEAAPHRSDAGGKLPFFVARFVSICELLHRNSQS